MSPSTLKVGGSLNLAELLGGGPKRKSKGSSSSQHGEKSDKKDDNKYDKTSDQDVCPARPENVSENAVFTATGVWCIADGRKCRLCVRCDSDDDPSWKSKGIVRAMFWGYSPRPSLATSGYYCGCCVKVNLAVYQSRCVCGRS